MASTATLKFLLLAENHASKAMKDVGGDVDKTGKKIGGMSTGAKVALAGLGVAAVGFANSSINKFKQVTAESRGLQRAMGGTLEEASRMREAAILSGVDYDTFKKSIGKLDKTLVGATANQKTAAAMTKTLGVSFQDASGHVKPMGELLPQISDQFAKMPDGPEKTALAMKLFGKAGADMLPFLGKGSAGIAALEKQSDKFGTTLDNGAIKSMAKSREQTRMWQAGMDGLKVQIGAQLLPIMNKLIGFIQQYVIPIIQKITAFVREHKQAVMFAVVVIASLIAALKVWTIVQAILNSTLWENPIAVVVIALVALAAGIIYAYKHSETFRNIIKDVWTVIKTVIMAVWNGFLHPTFTAFRLAISAIGTAALWLWRNAIQPAWNGIKAVISGAWNNVIKPVASAISTAFRAIGDGIAWTWHNVLSPVFGWIRAGIRGVRDVIKPIIAVISALWRGIGTGLQWAWDHVIKPILDGIKSAIQTVKDAISSLNPFGGGDLKKGLRDQYKKTHPGAPIPAELRAGGGAVRAGMPYVVGEERPEMFVPDGPGRIVPRLSGGNGGGDINLYFTGQALVTKADIGRAVGQALEYAGNAGVKFHIGKAVV